MMAPAAPGVGIETGADVRRSDDPAMHSAANFGSAVLSLASLLGAQETKVAAPTPPSAEAITRMVAEGCEILVAMQEGEDLGRWPYEGVYRVRGDIPVGYRVGGTAIAGLALLEAPGWDAHPKRGGAVAAGVASILADLDHPLMRSGFEGTYDVRGWGHTYALLFFLRLAELDRVPAAHGETVPVAVTRLVRDLVETAIEPGGGWNYSRPSRLQGPRNGGSPFMTGPTLHALFHAAARGHDVPAPVVEAALESLERGRTASGGYAYVARAPMAAKTEDELGMMDRKPGSVGRMCVVEYTLALAGRGDPLRLRDGIESFFTHWGALKVRKQKTGTHVEPYGVAPYYFMYAHYYAARAIELVADVAEREGYRVRLATVLAAEREAEGGFNDRVFPRSRSFGTALGSMALMMRDIPPLPGWPPDATTAATSNKKR